MADTKHGELVELGLQVSLRDYFAAHAPTEPQGWFEPVMATAKPDVKYDHDHGCEQCYGFDGEQTCRGPINRAEREAWDDEYRRQYSIQWPYAWADAVLASRDGEQS